MSRGLGDVYKRQVADLTRIDYEAIFLNGLHEEGDSNGLSN